MKSCDFCGAPETTNVAGQMICDDCYIARGSCCAEWPEEDGCKVTSSSTEPVATGEAVQES